MKQYIRPAVATAAFLGGRRGMSGLGAGIAKGLIKEYRVRSATSLYREGNIKFKEYKPAIQKKAKDRYYGR